MLVDSADKDESLDVFVGDVTSYTLQNLLPGTPYDVKVTAQYSGGTSGALIGQGTTRTYPNERRSIPSVRTLCLLESDMVSLTWSL